MPGPLTGRVAVVSGANHGIGAATAVELARLGADVAVTYLAYTPTDHDHDHDRPDAYRTQREQGPDRTVAAIEALGRRVRAVEADLVEPDSPGRVFAEAEAALGAVSILVNNASGWRKDTFAPDGVDAVGRAADVVSGDTAVGQLLVDARGGALMIAELAASVRRHHLGWGRIVSLTSGGPNGFPGEVSYGAAKAALENYTMSASIELAELGVTANVVHPPVTDTGWVRRGARLRGHEPGPRAHRLAGGRRGGDRVGVHRCRPTAHRQRDPAPLSTSRCGPRARPAPADAPRSFCSVTARGTSGHSARHTARDDWRQAGQSRGSSRPGAHGQPETRRRPRITSDP